MTQVVKEGGNLGNDEREIPIVGSKVWIPLIHTLLPVSLAQDLVASPQEEKCKLKYVKYW